MTNCVANSNTMTELTELFFDSHITEDREPLLPEALGSHVM